MSPTGGIPPPFPRSENERGPNVSNGGIHREMPIERQRPTVSPIGFHSRGGVFGIPIADGAEDPPEGAPHLVVPIGINDGVDQGVDLSQQEDVFLHGQNVAALTTQPVQQQHHLPGGPTDQEGTCRERWTPVPR